MLSLRSPDSVYRGSMFDGSIFNVRPRPANANRTRYPASAPDRLLAEIDLGSINLSDLKSNSGLTNVINQTLMIYQEGGKDFRASATTDLGVLNLGVERSKFDDRCEIHVEVAVNKLAPGPINGFIRIKTNDPEFPQLNVPVTGTVE
jgi:hypothetical protein